MEAKIKRIYINFGQKDGEVDSTLYFDIMKNEIDYVDLPFYSENLSKEQFEEIEMHVKAIREEISKIQNNVVANV